MSKESVAKSKAYKAMLKKRPIEPWITIKEVSAILGKHRTTIRRWVKQGVIPAPDKLKGKSKGWKQNEFEAWYNSL